MNREEFDNIVHNVYRKLFRIAFRILGNQQEAEDVVQEIFMKMWIMKGKLDPYNDLEALAVTMTKNYSVDLLRKRRHISDTAVSGEIQVAEYSVSPFELLAGSETMSILKSIIESLPECSRQAVIMREIDGLSYEEIASVTGSNVNSVRVAVSRARQTIREKYNSYFNERGKAQRAY